MTRTRVEILRNAGTLPGSVENAHQRWGERTGLLLRIHSGAGEVGQGEASPLPGYSVESLEDAHLALQSLSAEWIDDALALNDAPAILNKVGSHSVATIASARFAVETALLDALGQQRSQPIWRLLSAQLSVQPCAPIPLAQLLPSKQAAETLAVAESAWELGVRHFKLKVGTAGRWTQELKVLSALRERFGPAASLRVDANGAFAESELTTRLAELLIFAPQFVEEPSPFAVLSHQPTLPMPIALDETLAHRAMSQAIVGWARAHAGTVLVLKPMNLGGFGACLDWASIAHECGATVVVSHLFDGPVARAAAAQLALAITTAQLAAGLGTHGALDTWPPVTTPWLTANAITPSDEPGLGMPPMILPTG